MHEVELARSGVTVGKRAQEYGQTQHIISVRKAFSFTVDGNRLADVAFSSRSRPRFNHFVENRVGIWYWSDPAPIDRMKYRTSIDDKIEKALRLELVELDTPNKDKACIAPGKKGNALQEIGKYYKNVYESVAPYMSRKIRSGLASYVTDWIFREYPEEDEIMGEIKDLRFECPSFTRKILITGQTLLSQLEAISVIKRVGDRFVPFYAFEIFGTDVEKLLNDNIYDSHLDNLKNMIIKLPGISKSTLVNQLVGHGADKEVIEKAISRLWSQKIVYIIKTEETGLQHIARMKPEAIVIPSWFLHFIMDEKPGLVQTEAFLLTLISLSWFWDNMKHPLDEYDNQIERFNDFVDMICKGPANWHEIFDLGVPITHLAWTLRTTGLLLDSAENEETHCLEESKTVLKAIQNALRHSYLQDLWLGALSRRTNLDSVILEIEKAAKSIDEHILSKWRPNELMKSIPDFK